MKGFHFYLVLLFCIIISGFSFSAYGQSAENKKTVNISGKIIDGNNKKNIGNVSITLDGTNIGTVSNADGNFSLYCPVANRSGLKFSAVGYSTVLVPLDSLTKGFNTIKMYRRSVNLSEVFVFGGKPEELVEEALKKIPVNYSGSNDLLEIFYREVIKKGRRFVGVSEAAIDVYKTPYARRDVSGDKVRIERGRRLVSQKNTDTIAVKILGGPNLALGIDFVKNADILLSEQDLPYLDFKMEKPEYVEGRPQYVVSFKPKIKLNYPQFRGTLYIDSELIAFTRAEFEMDPSDKAMMTSAILHKKPRGLRFSPQKIEFIVSYKQKDGKTYLNYIQNVMRFKCDMKRRLFSSAYEVFTEMVVVDREENTKQKISMKEAFKPRQIFYDLVDQYWDENYWLDYNIIEPTESLEHAVDKLRKNKKI